MGIKQSKRSVEISSTPKKGVDVPATVSWKRHFTWKCIVDNALLHPDEFTKNLLTVMVTWLIPHFINVISRDVDPDPGQ